MPSNRTDQHQRIVAALKALTPDDVARILSKYFDRMPRRSTWEPPEKPEKVEELPLRTSSELSHILSHYDNPPRVRGVLTLKMP